MRRRILALFAVVGTIGAGVLFSSRADDDFVRSERRGSAKKRAALSLLSPPGAGYDSVNVSLTTGSGSAVTVSRASTQTCEQTPGMLTTVAADKPCVESGALKVEPSGSNLVASPNDFSTFTMSNVTVSTNTTAAPDGTTTADTGTTTAANGSLFHATSAASGGAYTASVYARAVTGTQSFSVRIFDNTASAVLCTGTVTLTTDYQRVSCTTASTTATNAIRAQVYPGGAGGSGASVMWCAQLEAGSVATSCMTTSRAAQTTTVAKPASLSTTEGAAKVCVTPAWTGNAPAEARFLQGNTAVTALIGYAPSAAQVFRAFDGANNPNVSAAWVAGQRLCFRTSWSASRNVFRVENLNTGASGSAAFTALGALSASTYIGADNAGSSAANAKLDSICLSSSPDGCR